MEKFEMKPGVNYIVIPSTFKPDLNGEFLIRFISEKPLIAKEL